MLKKNENIVLDFIKENPFSSSSEIHERISDSISYATVKRILSNLVSKNLIFKTGKGKNTKYSLSPSYKLFQPIDIEKYYEKEIDERTIKGNFNFDLIQSVLQPANLFTLKELDKLNSLQKIYSENISKLSDFEYKKELERLSIDLSWKSSQIEGNTYTLLETERLLKDKETALGKTREEAAMLLNHKEAIDFIIDKPDYFNSVAVSKIENIHSILIKDLGISRNIRRRRVGISGTNYRPLDNEYQIREALNDMCKLMNEKENVFEKALLALVLISYIQPFIDGNKRTARIISNAVLISRNYCPISFRTVDSIEYKKATLLFYEQNNISAIKNIFINQFEFAVNTYF